MTGAVERLNEFCASIDQIRVDLTKAQTDNVLLKDQLRIMTGLVESHAAENVRLRAIVSELPETADGVPVLPGQHVFWMYAPIKRFRPLFDHERGMSLFTVIPVDGGASEPMCEMYSTQEAAEIAGSRLIPG